MVVVRPWGSCLRGSLPGLYAAGSVEGSHVEPGDVLIYYYEYLKRNGRLLMLTFLLDPRLGREAMHSVDSPEEGTTIALILIHVPDLMLNSG